MTDEPSPRTRLLAKLWPEGSVRKMGCSSEKHSTGAATLVIHMDANVATSMLAISTYCGLLDTWAAQGSQSALAKVKGKVQRVVLCGLLNTWVIYVPLVTYAKVTPIPEIIEYLPWTAPRWPGALR